MTSLPQQSISGKDLIKCWWIPLNVESFESHNVWPKENAHIVSHTANTTKYESVCSGEKVNTSMFYPSVGDIKERVKFNGVKRTTNSQFENPNAFQKVLFFASFGRDVDISDSARAYQENANGPKQLKSFLDLIGSVKVSRPEFNSNTIEKEISLTESNVIIKQEFSSSEKAIGPNFYFKPIGSSKEMIDVSAARDHEKTHFQNHRVIIREKIRHALDMNKHAIAGALAGTVVSLCLHPIDTIKTIIQSNAMAKKSYFEIIITIASEKGVKGFYRGVSSNVAFSAPISAIYTLTYELVKEALLPILPKEFHYFAHTVAGGCSSIATSFIYTPCEQIKQQMQKKYFRNALIECLRKGGVSSLYAGWDAVLCRNIPQSIIKFYTYERMKQLLLSSAKADATLNEWKTLVCGGVAGCTAVLFTTPFDVVKTRLQMQTPGSVGQYNGVFHALQEIAKQEGLQGLYRGLIPRLAVYIFQGAIFFASYEHLKTLISSQAPQEPVSVLTKYEIAKSALHHSKFKHRKDDKFI